MDEKGATDAETALEAGYARGQAERCASPASKVTDSPRRRRSRAPKLAFAASTLGVGPAYAGVATYVTLQIQTIGFTIGHAPGAPRGTGCPPSAGACRVPWGGSGSSDVNLTSYLLYLNAIAYAASGLLTLIISGVGDHIGRKREQVTILLILYGAVCLPVAALLSLNGATFRALSAIFVVFNVLGLLAQAWQNVLVPLLMDEEGGVSASDANEAAGQSLEATLVRRGEVEDEVRARSLAGVKMSTAGTVGFSTGNLLFYVVGIAITFADARNAGLYLTTAGGALCIFLALGSYRFLPRDAPGARPARNPGLGSLLRLPFVTFARLLRSLRRHPEAVKFLIAYTLYYDTQFAFSSVIGQLFNLELRPSVREYTLYSLVGSLASIGGVVGWALLFPRAPRIRLRSWSMLAYGVAGFVAFWCMLGLGGRGRGGAVGFKHRAEFYVMQVVLGSANAVANSAFRVLFGQLLPRGEEIQYFGLQLVLSCSTTWVPQVVDGPIVNATNNPRVPGVVSFVFFALALGMAWWTKEAKGVAEARGDGSAVGSSGGAPGKEGEGGADAADERAPRGERGGESGGGAARPSSATEAAERSAGGAHGGGVAMRGRRHRRDDDDDDDVSGADEGNPEDDGSGSDARGGVGKAREAPRDVELA